MNVSNHLPQLPTKGTDFEKIRFLYNELQKVWGRYIEAEKKISSLQALVNSEVSTKRIVEIIGKIADHTSAMPDQAGSNTDHDKRYLTREEWLAYLRGEISSTNLQIGIWRFVASGNDLELRYDQNLGVGTPDFSGDAYETSSPA